MNFDNPRHKSTSNCLLTLEGQSSVCYKSTKIQTHDFILLSYTPIHSCPKSKIKNTIYIEDTCKTIHQIIYN